MADVSSLLGAAIGADQEASTPTPGVSAQKQSSVLQSAEQKKESLAGTQLSPEDAYKLQAFRSSGAGGQTLSPVEQDLTNLTSNQLREKYGEDTADRLIRASLGGTLEYTRDITGNRTDGETAYDLGSGVGLGLANSVGGIAALGLGLANNNAGAWAADQLKNLNELVQGTQSDNLQSRHRAQAARSFLNQRDTTAQYEKDKESDGSFMAGLKRVGRDVLNSVGDTVQDPTLLSDGVAQGVGSVLAAGPTGKAASLLGRALVPTATRASLAANAAEGSLAARMALGAGSKLPGSTSVAIGAIEAGGSYQQSAQDVLETKFEELEKNSPRYRDLISQGVKPEDARKTVANETGLMAGALTAPFAVGAGTLVSKFEANPFKVSSLRHAGQNILKETLEEGIQSGTGQLSQNYASSKIANENQDMLEGVGEQIGQGALFGMGTAGALQAPGTSTKALSKLGQVAGRALITGSNVVQDRVAQNQTKNETSSPVSEETVQQATQEAQTQAPEAIQTLREAVQSTEAQPEVKAEHEAYVDRLTQGISFSDEELNDPQIPEEIRSSLAGSQNRLEAMSRLSSMVEANPKDLNAALMLHVMSQKLGDVAMSGKDVFKDLPQGSPGRKILRDWMGLTESIRQTPKVSQALDRVEALLAQHQENIQPVTDESIQTPEGLRDVKMAVAGAEIAPNQANPQTIDSILQHASNGRLKLTQAEHQSLVAVQNILQATARARQAQEAQGHTRPLDAVQNQVLSDFKPGMRQNRDSAMGYATRIFTLMRSNQVEDAQGVMKDFGQFVRHMQNKLEAVNKHFSEGRNQSDQVSFQAWNPDAGKWYKSQAGVTPSSQKSVEFAQSVGLETQRLIDIYNGLSQAMPQLQAGQATSLELHPLLRGNTKDVANAFRTGSRQRPVTSRSVVPEQDTQAKIQKPQTPQTPKASEVANSNRVEAKPVTANDTTKTQSATATTKPANQNQDQTKNPTAPSRDTDSRASENPGAKEAVVENIKEPKKPESSEMDRAFPNLVGSDKPSQEQVVNHFKRAFVLPTEPRSHLLGDDAPLKTVGGVLSSPSTFARHLGDKATGQMTAEASRAWKGYISQAPKLIEAIDRNFESFLAKDDLGAKFRKGTPVNLWRVGRLMNIAQDTGETYKLDRGLVESAVLAGMQWMLSTSISGPAPMNEEAVAGILGINEDEVPSATINWFNQGENTFGVMQGDAARELAAKIREYWGLQSNPNAERGFTQGIPEAMAKEVLRAFLDRKGFLTQDKGEFDAQGKLLDEDSSAARAKTVNLLRIQKIEDPTDPLVSVPKAIDQAVLIEPEDVTYYGDQRPKVASTQLRNPTVENTRQQRQMIRNAQDTAHYVNTTMLQLWKDLGQEQIRDLFAGGDTSKVLNKEHLKTLEGQNRTVLGAYDFLLSQMEEAQNVADTKGVSLDELPIHYAFNVTKIGRLQMLGRYNPQSSKLLREVILPTRTTLDLSDPDSDTFKHYALALAQHLGTKVHTKTLDASVNEVLGNLDSSNGSLKPAVEMFQDWLKGNALPDDAGNILRQALGTASPGAVHALVDYARWMNASPDERKSFKTSLYLEADGVTNGPVNAMMLLTLGRFTSEWLNNIAKGGFYPLVENGPRTMNDFRQRVNSDLYLTSSDKTQGYVKQLRDGIQDKPELLQQSNALLFLMDQFFGSDLEFNEETGELTIKRGLAKNPLTITIYGSGEKGIASKLSNIILDELYERMSEAAQRQAENPKLSRAEAFFPNNPDAEAQFSRTMAALEKLTTLSVFESKEKGLFAAKSRDYKEAPANRKMDWVNFKLTESEFKALQSNMLHLFVKPMRAGITDTVGGSLMKATALLQQATAAQSVMMKYAYRNAVEARQAEKKAKDPSYNNSLFLSQNEQDEIRKSLSDLAPILENGAQTFDLSGSENGDLVEDGFSEALDGSFRTPGTAYAPRNAGVAGTPTVVVGMGDGRMVQEALTSRNPPKDALWVYDGVNVPVDKIMEYSQLLNQAVHESWKGNPLRSVLDSFERTIQAKPFEDFSGKDALKDIQKPETRKKLEQEMLYELERALLPSHLWQDRNTTRDWAFVKPAMESIQKNLGWAAKSIDARHKALSQIGYSVDQMASAGANYTKQGTSFASNEDALEALNQAYRAAMGEVVSEVDTTSAQILQLSDFKPSDPGQREILRLVSQSPNIRSFQIVQGTPEQIAAYRQTKGLPALDPAQEASNRKSKGYISFGDQTIYLQNNSPETMLHELVHAATFGTILDHYEGKTQPEHITASVQRLEKLMQQFLASGTDLVGESPEAWGAWVDASQAILEHLSKPGATSQDKAKALNEFMAWTLSNPSLAQATQKIPVLQRIAKGILDAIKALFGAKLSQPGESLFSNLKFETEILIQSQPSILEQVQNTTLHQSSTYGEDPRLTSLDQAFTRKVVQYLKNAGSKVTRERRKGELSDAAMEAARLTTLTEATGLLATPQEVMTYRNIQAALSTQAEIDPAAMSKAQELYAHTMKHLTVESFLPENSIDAESELHYAQDKFNLIAGKTDRSALLPTFLALSLTSNEFRDILFKLPMPKGEKNQEGTLDAALENLGMGLMDRLSDHLAGTSKSRNVQQAMDALSRTITDQAQEKQATIDTLLDLAGKPRDIANDYVVQSLDRLSRGLDAKTKQLDQKYQNRLTGFLKGASKLTSALVRENRAEIVAQGIMKTINQGDSFRPLRELVNDLVGRTRNNKNVYDLIKIARSMVQQDRQHYREELPSVIAKKFSRKLTDAEWSTMHLGLGKADLASLVQPQGMSSEELVSLLDRPQEIQSRIKDLENTLSQQDGSSWKQVQAKAQQLATYMMTGKTGSNLLRNARAVARMLNTNLEAQRKGVSDEYVSSLDQLISLYAFQKLNQNQKDQLSSLARDEAEGMNFVLSYLVGQRTDENAKSNGRAYFNHYKGYIPSLQKEGMSLIVADNANHAKLLEQSYVKLADYEGSEARDLLVGKSYYFRPVSSKAAYSQGILQNVRPTANGVDRMTGFSQTMTAGRIMDRAEIKRITRALRHEDPNGRENFLPVFGSSGEVVAYERSVDPAQLEKLGHDTHLARMIGVWRGRQIEEMRSQEVNKRLFQALGEMYEKGGLANKSQYVNLFDPDQLKDNPVLRDTISLMTQEDISLAQKTFGKGRFMVRRDMLNDAMGYREASVGDAWTGNSYWNPERQKQVKNLAISVFGNDAYRLAVQAERLIQNVAMDARNLIVMKSVIVPVQNMTSNLFQLMARGVPIASMIKGIPQKLAEIRTYTKGQLRVVEAEAELRTASLDPVRKRKLDAEIQSIKDGWKRLTIWPLIQNGEFSAISDAGISRDEILLSEGRLQAYIEKLTDHLPEAVKTAGKYALITKDTSLFQGLQKSIEYGDFIAKAIFYDDLVRRKKLSREAALGQVTEEFVNYDRLTGRTRSYLEKMGLMWFFNYKIRSTKVALSMLRHNPVHSILSTLMPYELGLSGVGTPLTDNLVSKAIDGSLGYSIGPGMGLRSPMLNPWLNLVN